ncbi:hypothetical protein Q3G72_019110 [Acer saccharum]|nr:hypothetical protein Q3G72_019110 [Acer saccharum]
MPRVLLSAEQTPNSENQQNMYTVDTSQDSSSKPQDDDVKTELAVSERPANNHVPYLPDGDYISRDDFFDPDDWLKELESNNNQDGVQDNAGHKYTASASDRPTEVVVYLGLADHEALRQANSGQEANYRDAGPSTSSHSRNVASSSNSNSAAV